MNTLDRIKNSLKEFEEKRKLLVDEFSAEFPILLSPFFEKSEKLKSFGWRQYTIYFNDGDSCEFSVYLDNPEINGKYDEDIECLEKGIYATITPENIQQHIDFNSSPEGYSWYKNKQIGENGWFSNPNYDREFDTLVTEIKEFLQEIPESIMEDVFGDHKRITIHRDGTIDIEEYTNHD